MDIAGLIKRWPPHVIAYLCEEPKTCEDCEQETDLGHKCRACYLVWRGLLWQDVRAALDEFHLVARQLNIVGDSERKVIADVALGHATKGISGRQAELYAIVKRVMAGPFGPQLEAKLQAIRAADNTAKKGRRSGSMEVD